MKLKINDLVLCLSGKDRGLQGKVIAKKKKSAEYFIIEELKIAKRHTKQIGNQLAGIYDKPMYIHRSNLKLVK